MPTNDIYDDPDGVKEEYPEDRQYFIDCTCKHEPEAHGYMYCEKDDCHCEGHWEY